MVGGGRILINLEGNIEGGYLGPWVGRQTIKLKLMVCFSNYPWLKKRASKIFKF